MSSTLQGVPIDPTPPVSGEGLIYNGTAYVPTPANPGDITAVNTTLPLTGGGASGALTLDINNFTGDSGAGGLDGAVPAPAAGDAAAGRFLSAGGTWAVPSGGITSLSQKMVLAAKASGNIGSLGDAISVEDPPAINGLGADLSLGVVTSLPAGNYRVIVNTGIQTPGGGVTKVHFGLWLHSSSIAIPLTTAPFAAGNSYATGFAVISVLVGQSFRFYGQTDVGTATLVNMQALFELLD